MTGKEYFLSDYYTQVVKKIEVTFNNISIVKQLNVCTKFLEGLWRYPYEKQHSDRFWKCESLPPYFIYFLHHIFFNTILCDFRKKQTIAIWRQKHQHLNSTMMRYINSTDINGNKNTTFSSLTLPSKIKSLRMALQQAI